MKFLLTLTLLLTLVYAQNFGVDEANPLEKLHVGGNIRTDGALLLNPPADLAPAAAITVPDGISSISISNAAGTQANALTPPATPKEGQLLYIANNDDDIATFAGTNILANGGFNSYMYLGGQWRLISASPVQSAGWQLLGNTATNPATDYLGTTDAQPLRIGTNGTERARVTAAGNVGIGTAAPSQTLHVAGNTQLDNALMIQAQNGAAGSDFTVNDNVSTVYASFFGGGADYNINPPASPIEGQLLTVVNDYFLQASFDGKAIKPRSAGIFQYLNGAWHTVATGGNDWALGGNNNVDDTRDFLGTLSAEDLVLITNNIERARILGGNGFVGIGTASPTQRLHVNGGILTDSTLSVTPASVAAGASPQIPSGISTLRITNDGANVPNAFTAPTTAVEGQILTVINEDADDATFAGATIPATNAGIFQFVNGAWVTLSVVENAQPAWLLTGNTATNPATDYLGTTYAQPLRIGTNGTERARFTTAGNLGIGTASPAEVLHVAQNARIDGNLQLTPQAPAAAVANTFQVPDNKSTVTIADDANAAAITVAAPATVVEGQILTILNLDADDATFAGATIQGTTNAGANGGTGTFQFINTAWRVLNVYPEPAAAGGCVTYAASSSGTVSLTTGFQAIPGMSIVNVPLQVGQTAIISGSVNFSGVSGFHNMEAQVYVDGAQLTNGGAGTDSWDFAGANTVRANTAVVGSFTATVAGTYSFEIRARDALSGSGGAASAGGTNFRQGSFYIIVCP